MPAPNRSTFTLPFWLANVVNLLCLTGAQTFVLLPLYLQSHGLQRWEIGVVAGSYSLVSVFVRPWLGSRLDRQGRRLFFVNGAALLGLLPLAFLAAPPTLPAMVLLRGVQGLAMALYFTALWTWVADFAPEGRLGETLGFFGISGLLAGGVGPILAERVLKVGGFPSLFALAGGLALAAALVSRHLQEQGERRAPESEGSRDFWRLSWSPGLRGTVLASLAFGGSSGTFVAFAAPLVAACGQPGVGLFFTVYNVASISVRFFAGRSADRWGPARIVPPGLACQALGLALLSRLQGEGWLGAPLLWAAALAAGTGHGLIYPALSSLAVQKVGPTRRGVGTSLFMAAIDFGAFSGALLAGLLAQAAGYPDTFLAVAVAVALAAALQPWLEGRSEAREDFPSPLP